MDVRPGYFLVRIASRKFLVPGIYMVAPRQ
jgi:hypothetical protein